jgi:two-component sensor histidine kinase
LATVLDNVMCDRAALLQARMASEFSVEQAVGYWGDPRPDTCRIQSAPDFTCVSSRTPPSSLTAELQAIVGLPYLLWCFDRASGYALILGARSEGNVARPFEEADRPILQGALDMLLDLREKERLRREREVLVDELQHRVRNNLQVVYGMLSNEIERRGDRHATGIETIARRVLTMAEVYDHLLGRGMSRIVDFGAYLKDLCASLAEFQSGRFGHVVLSCQAQSVHVELDTVTSIGLAIAELIANSYEHAFPKGTGSITVTLRPALRGGRAIVTVADDGLGFAPEETSKRHGLGLVRRLERGTVWTVELPAVANAQCGLQ